MQRTKLLLRRWLPMLAVYGALWLLIWGIGWSVETGRATLKAWIILWPVFVAAWVHERINQQRSIAGFEFRLDLNFEHLSEHPLVAASHKRYLEKRTQLPEEECDRLFSTSIYNKDIAYLVHGGLTWSRGEKNYTPISVNARCYGDLVGPKGTESADAEPSILVEEHNGRIKVAIVPMRSRPWYWREASVGRASRILAGNRDYSEREGEEPEPAVIADIPLGELMTLECAPPLRYQAAFQALLARCGFERNDASASTIHNDFVNFAYRRVERPFWNRHC